MYPSIPQEEGIATLLKHNYKLPFPSIVATRLLNFILKNYFAFNNKHYQQISRVATGTPTFANFVRKLPAADEAQAKSATTTATSAEPSKGSNLETVEEKAKALAKGKEEGKANQLSPTRVEANQSLLEPQGSTVVPFGKATTEQQEQWRALHMAFWKQRTEMAIAFEKENAEKSQPRGEETIRLLSKGLTFIPKPRIEKRVTLRRGVEDFIRKLRLKYVFRNRDKPVPELYRRTGYGPGTTESQVLERFITTLRETRQTEPDRQPNTGVCHTGDGGETILTPLYQQSSGPSNFTCTTSCHLVYERAEMN
ncbi:hypothetical protein EMCRGX_G004323 [Ephydatia muelleri]